jgi:hypothetical protein
MFPASTFHINVPDIEAGEKDTMWDFDVFLRTHPGSTSCMMLGLSSQNLSSNNL